jgi:hypothetical protein
VDFALGKMVQVVTNDMTSVQFLNQSVALFLGLLKFSNLNFLPVNASGNFEAGDGRVNQNPPLIAMHTSQDQNKFFVNRPNKWLK